MVTDNSKPVGYLMRMMPPLRREFGQRLDVQLFLTESNYAMGVLQKGMKSQDARFRECAEYVSKLRLGLPAEDIGEPTVFSASAYAESKPFVDPAGPPLTESKLPNAELTEDELRAHAEKNTRRGCDRRRQCLVRLLHL